MMSYYAKLAYLSICRTPVMSLLTVITLGIGIGVSMTTLSLFYMMSSNPLSHKNDVLYAVQLDSYGKNETNRRVANHIPAHMTYQDTAALRQSDIPLRQVTMFSYGMAVTPAEEQKNPYIAQVRVSTRDFFAMFDVPFLYGGVWSKAADESPENVVVIDFQTNEHLFNGRNSIGETMNLDGNLFTVIGVLEPWQIAIKVYDLNESDFEATESLFIPFSLAKTMEMLPWGNVLSWTNPPSNTYQGFLQSETIWLQHWAELPTAETKRQFEQFIENYIREQKTQGRFQKPLSYALSTPSQWIQINGVVSDDNRALVCLSLAFLVVCVVNALALIMAKFIRAASQVGVRRALGASQSAIFYQHLFESGAMGLVGGGLGLIMAQGGLMAIDSLFNGQFDSVAKMDLLMMIACIVFAILASLFAGCYPAWRIAHTSPVIHLKTQ
ncbi:MAG: ABC transporter permease [Spongiibacteraceae bacterium]|nr:ABC transporter permease [Spongiibacteraceae bacterium]